MKLTELTSDPPKFLIYGGFGTGKTAFTETLGKDLKILDLDLGAKTGLRLVDKWQSTRMEVDVEPFKEPDSLSTQAWTNFKTRLIAISTSCMQKAFPFKCLAIDSLSAMGDAALKYILQNNGQKTPRIQDWGLAMSEVEQMLYIVRSLPLVVVVCAHDQSEEVDEQTQVKLSVIGRKLIPKVPAYFDEVYYAKVLQLSGGIRQFSLQTRSTPSIPARSRLSVPNPFSMDLGFKALLSSGGFDLETFKSPLENKPTTSVGAGTSAVSVVQKGPSSTPTTVSK